MEIYAGTYTVSTVSPYLTFCQRIQTKLNMSDILILHFHRVLESFGAGMRSHGTINILIDSLVANYHNLSLVTLQCGPTSKYTRSLRSQQPINIHKPSKFDPVAAVGGTPHKNSSTLITAARIRLRRLFCC